MTKKELKEKIALLETELIKVKEIAETMKKRADGGVFKPEDGKKYWFISDDGDTDYSHWVDTRFDESRYAIGNCFPTEQAAEDTVRVLKLVQKARESQEGFVPDWEDLAQYKHHLYFDSAGIYVVMSYATNAAPIFGYWEDKSMCEQFIDENHDELTWFFTEYRR